METSQRYSLDLLCRQKCYNTESPLQSHRPNDRPIKYCVNSVERPYFFNPCVALAEGFHCFSVTKCSLSTYSKHADKIEKWTESPITRKHKQSDTLSAVLCPTQL